MTDYQSQFLTLRKQYIDYRFRGLNEMQKRAALTTEGPILILAGAGSGKTTVLVNRVANLVAFGQAYHSDKVYGTPTEEDILNLESAIQNGDEIPAETFRKLSVNAPRPWNILAITFTNKAAGELKDRLIAMIGEEASDIQASTFHSACVRILRRGIDRLGFTSNFTIYDQDDALRLLKTILKEMQVDDKMFPPKAMLHNLGRLKDSMVDWEEYAAQEHPDYKLRVTAQVYKRYQDALKRANAVDFDDIIYHTVRLFQQNPDVLEYYQQRYRYILVDEYQDTNRVQFELVSMLARGHQNLCVVGDDDQSIYKFRGATIENILNFEGTFPGAEVIRLEQNYRSTQNILDAANSVIANNTARKGKNLWTDKGDGAKIVDYTARDEFGEAEFIGDTVVKNVSEGRYRYGDHAILYRMNAQSNAIEKYFARAGVPYKIIGGLRFYDRKEIRDLVAYLSVLNNPSDAIRLKRIINEPKRGIGEATVAKAEQIAAGLGLSLYEVLREAESYPALSGKKKAIAAFTQVMDELIAARESEKMSELTLRLLEETGYAASLRAQGFEGETRLENIEEFVSNVVRYEQTAEEPSLQEFLEEIALITDIDNFDREADSVVLMTMHAAKGLEFPNVFIAGMEDGIFPGRQSLYSPEELEEERRLCYVGITRAKENLYLLHTRQRMLFGQTQRNQPSRFLQEIPEEYVEHEGAEELPSGLFGGGAAKQVGHFRAQNNLGLGAQTGRPAAAGGGNTYQADDLVSHKVFGRGRVLRTTPMGGDTLLEIAFEGAGVKKIMANFAKLEKL
ncbi:UvrD-helicase domain-containing protein [Bittarella massiliensis]|uniref:ATP-dependent helicase n=1 Tax=Bittarella massiliensis (ex Durand et al. 2017) TaxID=1720313 RepID=UPI00163B6A11|nr:UvrD-helicase domain-containing protein [Bittarella massiliensis (ex Durand et al. 2017)]MBC2872279.1 UvrD-helicase domain-containing protein [Bittarella massiliensis (ex Durand et al. 2017)]